MKRITLMAIVALVLTMSLSAQASLSKSASLPSIDGALGASEYQFASSSNGMKIAATLGSDDNLYLAVEAPSAGWAGLGVGGLVMNGSRLFLGAVQDGKPAFIEKAGVGHFYGDAKTLVVKKWAIKSAGGVTTLELSLPASAAVWKGQINATFAFSGSPSFSARHSAYGRVTFAVK
jgi:hypothetical protein